MNNGVTKNYLALDFNFHGHKIDFAPVKSVETQKPHLNDGVPKVCMLPQINLRQFSRNLIKAG